MKPRHVFDRPCPEIPPEFPEFKFADDSLDLGLPTCSDHLRSPEIGVAGVGILGWGGVIAIPLPGWFGPM